MFAHQVVAGRLYLFDPEVLDPITTQEIAWAAREALELPQPSYIWGLDLGIPGAPPTGDEFRGFIPGNPPPSDIYGLPQADSQEQALRVENAKSLYEDRPLRFLGANGTVWIVDGQRVFVSERNVELTNAIATRLAKGELEAAPPVAPEIPAPLTTRFYRVLPVGDTR